MDALSRIARDYAGQTSRLAIVIDGIDRAVQKSFVGQPMANRTDAETKRRIELCAQWFTMLRYDLQWSTQRCADSLVDCLRCELLGIDYKPSDRESWVADASDRDRIILLG